MPLERVSLDEDASHPGKIMIRGQFARSDKATENKRLYKETLWRREFGRLSEGIANRRMFGELDHPADGRTKLSRVSHIITKLDIRGNEVIGEAEVLDTPNGRIMQALAKAKAQVGVSSRGFGSTKNLPDGTLEVQEDFRLDTFDFVADPATKTAYPAVFREERERMFEGDDMTLDDLKQNYPGLVEELSQNLLSEHSGGVNPARLVTEAEERTTQRLTERFSVQLRRGIEVVEEEVAASVRSELMSDPEVAGAKQVLEQIVGLVKSYGIDPQARDELMQRDEDVNGLKAKLADRELEAQKLTVERDELSKLAKEAAYRLHLERKLSGDKAKETIEAVIGDVTTFASKDEIDAKVEAVRAELAKGGVYEDDDAETKEQAAAREEEIAELQAKIESLETAKKSEREKTLKAESVARRALAVSEGLEIKLYVEQSLAESGIKSEDRDSLRELCEGAGSQSDVDRVITRYKPQRRLDEDEADRIRSRVGRGKARDLIEDTNGGSSTGNGRGHGPLTEIGLNNEDFDRLAGTPKGRA
jgi:hypothetical protein